MMVLFLFLFLFFLLVVRDLDRLIDSDAPSSPLSFEAQKWAHQYRLGGFVSKAESLLIRRTQSMIDKLGGKNDTPRETRHNQLHVLIRYD